MEIYQLKGLNYYINEKEAFDKSVFNPAEYDVTLAVESGTELSDYITKGQQVSGEYTVNGLTTNFESLVQDVSISRQFQAGYDMYNLKLSENILNVDRAAILDVQDGGTGSGKLDGMLKGNGLSPVSTAIDGDDYWSPKTLVVDNREVPWTTLALTGVAGATAKWCVKNGNVYLHGSGNFGNWTGDAARVVGTLPEPAYRPSFNIQISASPMGGTSQMACEIRANGDLVVIAPSGTTGNKYVSFLLSYPVGV